MRNSLLPLRTILVACTVIGFCPAAAAQSACREPPSPPAIDGATATREQMQAAVATTKTFLDQMSDFQNCLVSEGEAADTSSPEKARALQKSIDARTASSQKLKESVGALLNAAIRDFNATHRSAP
jgi:hypothetical protein